MKTRYFALIIGIMFLLVGVMGFVPNMVTAPTNAPAIQVHAGYGYLLGLFPVNVLHNFVHITAGLLGIAAFWSYNFAKLYAQGMAIFYGLLAVMGFIPGANTTFGLIPIFGNDIWFHGVTAAISAYFGFLTQEDMKEADARMV